MFLMWIGHELSVNDGDSVCHVFEKGDESRTAYKYMTGWIEKNWTGDFTGMWERAQSVWANVSVENKAYLWSIDQQQEQNFNDIRQGLLATLKEYQGSSHVKGIFEEALKSVEF
jgi:hypothetical protein